MNDSSAWEQLPAEERERMLAALRAPLRAAHDDTEAQGHCSSMRRPAIVIVSARRAEAGLVLTWFGHYRFSFYAQSGSDWGDHVIQVKETTFGPNAQIVGEKLIASRTLTIPESSEKDYDDDSEAERIARDVLR